MNEQLGEYELVRHLATGGMAEIFIARQSGPAGFDRELAIKRILPHLAREERFISMFLDEARIAARLRHPNIVQIYELGEESGEYFIAMEYIEGGDLADLLDRAEERNVPIPIAMSVRIIADVLAALDYAHDFSENGEPLKIVHRDVSPHNVLIGRDGMIKLVDFGIAHAVSRHAKTETGLVKGKLSYMAPEQVEQTGVDRRADIFSAGALLYELLTGAPPFGRELAAVNAILNEDPQNPQLLRPDIPDELVEVLVRALQKDPEDRYQSAQQMLEALEQVLRVFDKYVSPKQVARFADALMSGGPFEGFDDVSQGIPRAVSREAMVRAAYGVGTPMPKPDDTEIDPPALVIPVDEEAPTVPIGAAIAEMMPVRSNESTFSGQADRHTARWIAAAVVGLLGIGGAVAVLGSSASSKRGDGDTSSGSAARSQNGEAAQTDVEDGAAFEVIELDAQFVDDDDLWVDDEGFTFGEEELELAELEGWVAALDPEQVDQMIAVNFERADGDYLWSVRGPKLARQVIGRPEPVNPGDPRAPKMLGLEDLDESVLKPKPRPSSRTKRVQRRARRPASKATPVSAQAKAAVSQSATPAGAKTTTKLSAPEKPTVPPQKKKKKKSKNDLKIIDRAVPY